VVNLPVKVLVAQYCSGATSGQVPSPKIPQSCAYRGFQNSKTLARFPDPGLYLFHISKLRTPNSQCKYLRALSKEKDRKSSRE
jgi:hypothetical protein